MTAAPPPTTLELICPGLLDPPDPDDPLPPTPALDRLLARADGLESAPRDPLETLAAAYRLTPPPDADLPVAALSLLAEAPDLASEGYWLHADPVHLRPDRDRLMLFAGSALAVREDESRALIDTFNAHFAPDRLGLVATRPGRWYLRAPAAPKVRTQPLYRVAGRPLASDPPTAADARAWARWQNEAQMLFFGHPVNRVREREGRPTLGGVWPWGGGALPPVSAGPALTVADHPLAAGLARASGGGLLGLADLGLPGVLGHAAGRGAASGSRAGAVLAFWDRLWIPALEGDGAAWRAAVGELEALTLDLLAELASGRLRAATLDDGEGGRWTLRRPGLRRFWRRAGLRERIAGRRGRPGRGIGSKSRV